VGTGEYILRRLGQLVPLLLILSIIVFTMIHTAPGDPAAFLAGPRATEEDIARIRHNLGLDDPLPVQYMTWLGKILRGDFGQSYINKRPVLEMFWERLPATVLLMGTANLVSLALAIPLGVFTALYRNTLPDRLVTVIAFLGISVPSFWFGLMLMYILGVRLHLLPLGGMRTIGAEFSVLDVLRHLLMPAGVLAFIYTAFWMRFVRSSVLEVLQSDYVRTSRAKGLPERIVLSRHILRNALLPIITIVGLSLPELVAGAVVIEAVFTWPGLGQLTLAAATGRDFTVVMAMVLIVSTTVVLGNLVADLAYRWADPRIRY
jgi:peptide/nickel transport system permease protein